MTQKEYGLQVEKEHKKTYEKIKEYFNKGKLIPEKEFYESIVLDHLDEADDYYIRLKDMEQDFKVRKVLQLTKKCLNMYTGN